MGTRQQPGFGALLIDDRFAPSTEAANTGATTFHSSYNQAGPVPGVPVPDEPLSTWRPQIVGAQSVSLDALTLQGGYPGRMGASVAVRLAADTLARQWRGWDEPNLVANWTAPTSGYGSGKDFDRLTACVITKTQELVLVGVANAGGLARTWWYSPRTEVWTDGLNWNGSAGPLLEDPIALAYDEESDRVILWTGEGAVGNVDVVAYYSTDKGVSWQLYSRGGWDQDTPAGGRLVVAPQKGRPWCAIRVSGGDIHQYVSHDHGVTWTRVVVATAICVGAQADLIPLKGGGFLVVYIEPAGNFVRAYRFGHAGEAFNSGTLNTSVAGMGTAPSTASSLAGCVDADGTVYLFVQGNIAAGDPDEIRVTRSTDDGVTWGPRYTWQAIHDNTGTVYAELETAVAAAGQIHVAHKITGDAALGNSMGLFSFGGWTNVEAGVGPGSRSVRTDRTGFGRYTGAATVVTAACWWPADQPEAMGWTKAGAGATGSLTTGTNAGMRLTAADAYYTRNYTPAAQQYTKGIAKLHRISGGSTTQADIGIRIREATGTVDFRAEIRIGSGGEVAVNDVHGGTTTTLSGVSADNGLYLRWVIARSLTNCYFSCWARSRDPIAGLGRNEWYQVVDKMQLSDKGAAWAADSLIEWGHLTGTAATSEWQLVAYAPSGDWRNGLDTAPQFDDADPTVTGHLGIEFGRPVPARASDAYPCPVANSTATEECGRIAGTGGPTHHREEVSLPVAYTRGMRNVYPAVAPSPSRYWESTSNAEQRIVWDQTLNTWVGGALGLVVIGSYARQIELAYDDGGAGWTVAGTLDLSLSGGTALNCSRSGSALRPRVGTATIGRYIHEGELVGGYVILSAGAGFVARRIRRNSGGYWTPPTGAEQYVWLDLEGIDGTEDVNGTVDIIAPSGVFVWYNTTAAPITRRRWRARWPASQVTPGGVYRAGTLGLGRIVGIGAEPGWDWERSIELERTVSRDRYGVPAVQQRAPPRQIWTYPWADGLDLRKLRQNQSADYMGIAGADAIGSVEDAWTAWWGHFEQSMRSGEVPCVLLPQLPAASGTITDPTMWFYGFLGAESVGATGFAGKEGTDELVRLSGVTIEGIR